MPELARLKQLWIGNSIQAVAESCPEIPLPCMRNLKTGPYFSVASVLEVQIIHIKIV